MVDWLMLIRCIGSLILFWFAVSSAKAAGYSYVACKENAIAELIFGSHGWIRDAVISLPCFSAAGLMVINPVLTLFGGELENISLVAVSVALAIVGTCCFFKLGQLACRADTEASREVLMPSSQEDRSTN